MKSTAIRLPSGDGFWDRAPRPGVLLLPVPVLLLAVLLGRFDSGMQLALLTLAGTLCALALIGTFGRQMATARQQMLAEAVPVLVGRDATPAFLADEAGTISYANAAADTLFPAGHDRDLAGRLATVIADPEAVIFRLQARALSIAGAEEEIQTRAGHVRLTVSRVGRHQFLWRCDRVVLPEDDDRQQQGKAATLPMLAVARSGAVLFLNDAFRKILNRRPKTLDEVFGPEDIETGQVRRIRTGDDQSVDCVVAVVPASAGGRVVYALPASVGQIAPDGARALAGEGWQAIEDLPVPLMKVAADGEILASNREARVLLSVQTTAGKRLPEILDGLGRPVVDWLRETIEDRSGHSSNFLRGRGEHQDTFVQVTLKHSRTGDDDGYLIAVLNDVTELKTLEAQFVQSQKMHAIGQLAGGVAHDFNNLLTAISGHCDLLLLRHDQDDHDYSDLVQIHQNANRAASLVGQLLAFSRKQNLNPEIVDLRDTLSDLTHLLNRLVGEKVRLTLNHDPNLAAIKADKRQLEQVMMNLVVNARDAMPKGGRIDVVTRNVRLDQEIERDRAFVPAGDYVEVRVVDQGHGIPPERLPKIFEPFYTTKRTGEGTGLGLSTAYGIVKQTGGYIFADSELGVGTTFTLLFPHHDLPATEDLPVAVHAPPRLDDDGDGVVLLVEDEAPVRAFASRALRMRGYTVLEADCAEEALFMLSDPELTVDLFVTDVIMPGKDGPTWVREALQDRPDTKVVFVSGYSEDAFSDGENRIPNSVFLPKPFSLNDLAATVQGQLRPSVAA